MAIRVNELLPHTKFEQRNALLDASPRNPKEVLPVGLGESAIPFGDIGSNGQGRAVELVSEEEVAARKLLRQRADRICESDGFLVDEKFLKGEGHGRILTARE
jgi:hypothetical protein